MLKITMKDGAVREAEAGISIQDFVKQVSNSLAKKVLAAKVDGLPYPRTGRQAPLQGCECAPGHRTGHRQWLLL